jgi:hypothetical protein
VGAAVFVSVLILWLVIFLARSAGNSSATSGYANVASRGIPARGILLSVASTGTKIGTAPMRYDQRVVTIDVEIPGEPPYEITTTATIPLNLVRDVLPGATVELRVDSARRDQISIVGPGAGFAMFALGQGTDPRAASAGTAGTSS